jgi:hypothetical protein
MKKHLHAAQIAAGAVAMVVATQAFAVDTGSSSLNSLNTWLMLWIPIGCVLGIIGIGVAIFFHMMKLHEVVRPVIGLIVIGSAAAIAGFFGLGT